MCMAAACLAQLAPQPVPATAVRYHFGDDPRWADPEFDDSAWPVAQDGRVPPPPFFSDGIVWVRARVAVPAASGRLFGVRQVEPGNAPSAEELFVDGRLTGRNGRLPPQPLVLAGLRQSIFPLGHTAVTPGATAEVALRTWISPLRRIVGPTLDARFQIDREDVLMLAARDRVHSLLVSRIALYILIGSLMLVAVGLLLQGRRMRRRELALFGVVLMIASTIILYDSLNDIGVPLPLGPWALFRALLLTCALLVLIEFFWRFFSIPGRALKYVLIVIVLLWACSELVAHFAYAATSLSLGATIAAVALGLVRDMSLAAICIWAMLRRPSLRLFAFLALLAPLFSLVGTLAAMAGIHYVKLGAILVSLVEPFRVMLLPAFYAQAGTLARGALRNWRKQGCN